MINVVLIEPEIPQNTGNIARTCAAVGARLHLVEPLGFKIDDSKLKRSGLDYWHYLDIMYYKGTDDFFEASKNQNIYFFTTKAAKNYSTMKYGENPYLVFGKETAGLPEKILKGNPDFCVRIPMKDSLRSLNLSNAVAVGVYEALRQNGFAGLKSEGIFSDF
ncbi:MAG: tRNA (uridine(34)/cytosine(34)/5-carboxymethylaminomethyluridine(34)-2'-O)-methyltransferase TrmL [Oscillospiraceae bacterium]|nr:tRNA (uridine(34)/cytosine(34)/5-carboxymethylaminomethyluridine(34)-2'-O)-methyltransferase TrmL [Oscillospiraceae bacterium]